MFDRVSFCLQVFCAGQRIMLEICSMHAKVTPMTHREADSEVCLRTPHRVLVYDPQGKQEGLAEAIRGAGYAVETVDSIDMAVDQFEQRDFPVVLIHIDSRGTGLDLIKRAHSVQNAAFIAVTDCAGCESAIQSLRAGARDYIVWPCSAEELKYALERCFEDVERKRFRDDMLCMLTHDIKIPLSSILGYSTLIFDKNTGKLNARARDFVKTINASGLKILSLIDNFLTSNKIDSGKLHLSLDDIDVGLFLEDLANTFAAELDRHRLHLGLELERDLPPVEADEGLLFRAVGNLLSNACKFSPEGTEVVLSARTVAAGENPACLTESLEIAVTNEGPGLDPDEIPEIFERFRRGHAQASIEGSGLGAYVVKSIAEAHGGSVGVESVPNGLTTFSICLPLRFR